MSYSVIALYDASYVIKYNTLEHPFTLTQFPSHNNANVSSPRLSDTHYYTDTAIVQQGVATAL